MTSKELAALLGVSQSTVSRSLNGSPLVKQETADRIRALAREYGYEINVNAKSLKTKTTGTIGIVLPEQFIDFEVNMYLSSLFNDIRNNLREHGYDLLALDQRNVEKVVNNHKVDGLIVIESSLNHSSLEYENANLPIIFYTSEQSVKQAANVVYTDHYHGGRLLGEYLSACGHQRILCVTAAETIAAMRNREKGLRDSLGESGIFLAKDDFLHGDLTFESGYQAILENHDKLSGYTALCVFNDAMALGAIEALKKLGIRVPDDISVTGYDGLKIGTWFRPCLTTISTSSYKIASQCCKLLYARLLNQELPEAMEVILPRLIVRESSRSIG